MNILFICTGNTCRSPMAEGYLDFLSLPNLDVRSRGLAAQGDPVSKNAATAMAEKGIDISGQLSEPVTATDLAWADKILFMSPSHNTVLRLYANENKLFLLGNGICDPFGGELDVYRKCRDEICAAIDALLADGFFFETIVSQVGKEHASDLAKLEQECFSHPWSEKTLAEAMDNGTHFFAAKFGEKIVGYVGISTILDEGYITNIAVTETHRHKGIGTALLERIFRLAKDLELAFISLEVRKSNQNAIRLYSALGFCEEGLRKNFYTDPTEDALIFTKRFEER